MDLDKLVNRMVYHEILGILTYCVNHKIGKQAELVSIITKHTLKSKINEEYINEVLECFLRFTHQHPLLFFHLKFQIKEKNDYSIGYFDGIGKKGELLIIISQFNWSKIKAQIEIYRISYFSIFQYYPSEIYLFIIFSPRIILYIN